MNSACLIDEKLFYRYLELEVRLSLDASTRQQLSAAIAYWNDEENLRDLRILALGLAEMRDSIRPEAGATSRALLTPEELKKLFDRLATDPALKKIRPTDAHGAVSIPEFANIFYSALVRMGPISLAQVLAEELWMVKPLEDDPVAAEGSTVEAPDGTSQTVLPRGEVVLEDPTALKGVFEQLHGAKLNALSFSGGGIRSATFGLGIVQALSENKLLQQFHYLSTVSGGGYLGSWLSAWIYREQKKHSHATPQDRKRGVQDVEQKLNCRETNELDDPNPEPSQLQHLREYSNYMSPRTGLLSADTWTLVAIYLRNLFLNLTIFVPSITAFLLLPRILFKAVIYPEATPFLELVLLIVAAVAACSSIAFVISSLPSKALYEKDTQEKEGGGKFKTFLNTDPGVFLFGVIPLVISAFLASVLWIWHVSSRTGLDTYRVFKLQMPDWIAYDLGYFLIVTTAAYLLGLIIFIAIRRGKAERDLTAAGAALLSSLIGGFLLWLVATKLFPAAGAWFESNFGAALSDRYFDQLFIAVSVPVFLIVVLVAASIFVGLMSRPATDEDREWLARYGALVLIVSGVWFVLNMLVLIGPSVWQWLFRFHWSDLFTSGIPALLSSILAVISGLVALIGGFSGRSQVREEPVKSRSSQILRYLPKIAAAVFLVAILVGLALLATSLLYAIGAVRLLDQATALREVNVLWLVGGVVALGLIGFAMACVVNVNKFSLHGAYRDRLVRAYLGASNQGRKQNTFTGFDDSDNIELHELKNQTPLHIINGTVNLVGGKNLAWQNRKAASFTMSPLHCGSWAVNGYRRSTEYCKSTTSGKALRLGTAMAISGAAANPNMGYYSSSIVTFLMSLFNIRLGWWLGNTGDPGSAYDWFGKGRFRFFQKVGPSIAMLPLLNETLGRTDEGKRFLMVTDGGHFENLALYEMVLRRCKLIVLSDGAADTDFKFGEIANAIQKCKVDLGTDIQFIGSMNIRPRQKEKVKETEKLARSRFAIARITYPETYSEGVADPKPGQPITEEKHYIGWLLYTRPTFYENEPRDILNYAESNDEFPHQSTGDQMYDEKQFEAYRGLGFLTMSEIRKIFDATAKGDPDDLVDDELEALFDREKDMRETLFGFFNIPDPGSFKTRAARRKKPE